MLTERMEKAINEQINAEMYSAYLYLSMSAYFEDKGLKGFAKWMYIQNQEEITHAMKFFHYVNERGGRIKLTAIEVPDFTWDSPLAVFKQSLEHEKHVTSLINNLVSISLEEKDYATHSMLNWYVDEQVEEEANATEIVNKLELIGDEKTALFMLDKELHARNFVDDTVAK